MVHRMNDICTCWLFCAHAIMHYDATSKLHYATLMRENVTVISYVRNARAYFGKGYYE